MAELDRETMEAFLKNVRYNLEKWVSDPKDGPGITMFGGGYITPVDLRKGSQQAEQWLDWYVDTLRRVLEYADKKEQSVGHLESDDSDL